jgi:hypothetical protein
MQGEAATLFGIALAMEGDEADNLRQILTQAFVAQHHRPPADVETDLADMRALRPGSSASALRRLVADAEVLEPPWHHVPEQLLIPITSTRALLTAEGRVVLDVIQQAGEADPVVIERNDVMRAHARVINFYAAPHRAWMTQQVRGGDLRPHVFAVSILLLLNGSIGPDRALRAEDEHDDTELSIRVAPVLDTFARGIGGKEELSDTEVRKGLRSAWPYTEAGRQLPGQVLRRGGGLWIDPREEQALVRRLGSLLAARTRPRLTSDELDAAFEATVAAYRNARPALASRRLAFQRSDHTERLRGALLDAFMDARAAG